MELLSAMTKGKLLDALSCGIFKMDATKNLPKIHVQEFPYLNF